jgi:hypothetical protein
VGEQGLERILETVILAIERVVHDEPIMWGQGVACRHEGWSMTQSLEGTAKRRV